MNWAEQVVLITGATGSFGRAFIALAMRELRPAKLIVFSRDELKQHEMRTAGLDHPTMRYFIGDVRDLDRVRRAMEGVDVVIHAAALKQVPACEYNPFEAVLTNITGAKNIIDAAIDRGVKRVLALSTDKAVAPVNLYGATKLVAERLFVQANAYSGAAPTRFSCVRYGNVVGSRGSVVPLFQEQRKAGRVTVTDRRMTRFWITLEEGTRFVARSVADMQGGEVFVPRIPSMNIMTLVEAIAPGCTVDEVGIRPGEKIHEVLVSEDEALHTVVADDRFVVIPHTPWVDVSRWHMQPRASEGFRYSSDTNTAWLTSAELNALLARDAAGAGRKA